jgi:hypothetical protein
MHPNTATNIYPIASPLERAAERLIQAKAAEIQAQQQRLVAELEVLDLLGEIDGEGTTKVEAGAYKLTVRTSMNRTIDRDELCQIANDIPEAIGTRLFRWKPELDLKELRFIQSNEPALYGIVARAIVMKSAKPSISVERVEG